MVELLLFGATNPVRVFDGPPKPLDIPLKDGPLFDAPNDNGDCVFVEPKPEAFPNDSVDGCAAVPLPKAFEPKTPEAFGVLIPPNVGRLCADASLDDGVRPNPAEVPDPNIGATAAVLGAGAAELLLPKMNPDEAGLGNTVATETPMPED